MSFSSDVKNEMASVELKDDKTKLAELAAFVHFNAVLQFSFTKGISIRFVTESSPIARRIFKIIKALFQYEAMIQVSKSTQLKRKNNYKVWIEDRHISQELLEAIGYDVDEISVQIKPHESPLKIGPEEKKAYLRGAFLGAGSISNPQKNYHLEIIANSEDAAKRLIRMMNAFSLRAKESLRKEQRVVYIKDSEKITDYLKLVGAPMATLKFEDIRAMKDLRNNVNRVVNCETANMDKTINASIRQTRAIEKLIEHNVMDDLPMQLREVAKLRLENPDMPLKDLGEMLDRPLAKSSVNRRLNKIIEHAQALEDRMGEKD